MHGRCEENYFATAFYHILICFLVTIFDEIIHTCVKKYSYNQYITFAFFTFHHKIQKKKWATNMMEKLSLFWPKLVWSSNQVDKRHLAALFLSERSVIFDIGLWEGRSSNVQSKNSMKNVKIKLFFFSGHWLFKIVCFNPSSSLFMFWKTTYQFCHLL